MEKYVQTRQSTSRCQIFRGQRGCQRCEIWLNERCLFVISRTTFQKVFQLPSMIYRVSGELVWIPFAGLHIWNFYFSFLIILFYLAVSRGLYLWLYYSICRTPWSGVRPDVRPLQTHRTTQNRKAGTHPCPKQNSNLLIRATDERNCLRPLGYWDRYILNYVR
jgi:hypothetical protein